MKLAATSATPRTGRPLPLPASVTLLADHLDAVLAMGEDLLALRQVLDRRAPGDPRPVSMHALVVAQRGLGDFVRQVRTLELAMTARIVQARKLAEEFKRSYVSMAGVADLFRGGTAVIADAVDASRSVLADRFDTGEAVMAFVASRGIIAADAPGLAGLDAVHVSEDTLLLGTLRLGTVMDVVARFLDTLDAAFDLYPQTGDSGLAVPAAPLDGPSLPLAHAPDVTGPADVPSGLTLDPDPQPA